MPIIQVPSTLGTGVSVTSGAGSPEGAVVAGVGSLYLQTDAIFGETLWRKGSGIGNTGWLPTYTVSPSIRIGGAIIFTPNNETMYVDDVDIIKTDNHLVVAKSLTLNAGDINLLNGGGFRQTADGWTQDNVAASQTNVELTRATGRFRAARSGSVTGVIATLTEARTAGTLTVTVFKNTGLAGAAGATIGLSAVINATNTSRKATVQDKDTDTFAAGDEIYAVVTTDSGWLPTTSDLRVAIEIED